MTLTVIEAMVESMLVIVVAVLNWGQCCKTLKVLKQSYCNNLIFSFTKI
jgi:hypothetical protein